MRVLFMENRYATRLFAQVAARLEAQGHQIHWIVQNPLFVPSIGTVHRIPFPRGTSVEPVSALPISILERVAASDRQILYFGRRPTHYAHYAKCIDSLIDELRPQVVFGESTQFYELLAIESCQRRGIAYLNPLRFGYPADRMCFFSGDTKAPFGGQGTQLTERAAREAIEKINQRQVVPEYMKSARRNTLRRTVTHVADRARISYGWLIGERYATPSPLAKFKVDRAHRKAKETWNTLATAYRPLSGPYVLYAMHVQPECSIDVWGRPWNDQAEIVQRAAAALAADGIALAVKPHPNSRYEVSERLCETVAASPNIVAVPDRVRIAEIFPGTAGVLSITGTILLEAVFAEKPAISLGPNAMGGYPGIVQIVEPEELPRALYDASRLDSETRARQAIELMQWLYRFSYPGLIFEPLSSPEKLGDANMSLVHAAFLDVMSQLTHGARAA